MVLHLM